jgi:riboflavin kinase / FMN adenylyltransferase
MGMALPLTEKYFVRGLHNMQTLAGGDHPGCVATIGSFDGVHRGHRVILEQVKKQARAMNLPSVVMIFEPQPNEYFSGEQAPARLMLLRDKVMALRDEGVDRVLCLSFNQRLRSMTEDVFIREVLVNALKVKHLVVGDDFRFGRDRKGDFALLKSVSARQGFALEQTLTVEHEAERISSTRIRKLLQQQEFTLAEELLGRPYSIHGKVVYGQQLGRTLGFPTANVRLNRYRSPLSGVFAVEVILDGQRLSGVANIGIRPTVAGLIKPILEVHLLDFDQMIYGKRISVRPLKKLREEKKFASLDELSRNIARDVDEAKSFFMNKE